MEAGAIIANPQLALWHSFNNQAPEDPASDAGRPGWMFGVRQYGMHTLLWFLTNFKGVDRAIITDGFYANTELSPQEYIFTNVGEKTNLVISSVITLHSPLSRPLCDAESLC